MVTDCAKCPLRRLSCFDSLTADEAAFMRRFKQGELKVEPGMPLLLEGTRSPQLFTALSGMGVRYKTLADGGRQVVNLVMPGDFLGLQAGVMGEMKHSAEATTPMVLCVFDRAEIWTLFRSEPERAFDLTWIAAMEEHFLGEALSSIGRMSALERLSWGLLRYFLKCEDLGLAEGPRCPFPFRQRDLADAVGLSLVHTNKTLMRMRERQVLSILDGTLTILDADRLAEISPLEIERGVKRPLL